MLGSIPSPSNGSIEIGPISIHAYGLMIALGVIAAVWLTGRRLEQAGTGKREDIQAIAIGAVLAGIVGARLYYVVTDKSDPWREPIKALQIWNGGLGIPGALLFGIPTGMWLAKRRGLSMLAVADAAAPALPLAQAIGRLGNWWNQELFGKPTKLPWGLEIGPEHLTQNGITYPVGTLFHPTFLYEALWNLALCLVLIWIGNHLKLRPGRLMVVYLFGYFAGRFWIEGLRIDNANAGGGLRLNQWVALAMMAITAGFLIVDWARHRNDPEPVGETSDDAPVDGAPIDDEAAAAAPLDDVPADSVDEPGSSDVEEGEYLPADE